MCVLKRHNRSSCDASLQGLTLRVEAYDGSQDMEDRPVPGPKDPEKAMYADDAKASGTDGRICRPPWGTTKARALRTDIWGTEDVDFAWHRGAQAGAARHPGDITYVISIRIYFPRRCARFNRRIEHGDAATEDRSFDTAITNRGCCFYFPICPGVGPQGLHARQKVKFGKAEAERHRRRCPVSISCRARRRPPRHGRFKDKERLLVLSFGVDVR